MTSHDRNEGHTITLLEAVEALSNLADLEFDQDLGMPIEAIDPEQPMTYRTVHWLQQQGSHMNISTVKDIFKTILNYFKRLYQEEYSHATDEKTVEGIKTIMVLVGEATKKLDKFTALFHNTQNKSVTELREYKQLEEFYFSHISRKVDEGVLGKWIMALSTRALQPAQVPTHVPKRSLETKHVYVDLDGVKKDSEYELFFIRKEDGTRFFSPRLVRNIKLVCDFGNYFKGNKPDDPLADLEFWVDRCLHLSARNIMKSTENVVGRFLAVAQKGKDSELVLMLNKALMALMLSSNAKNLMRNNPPKTSADYFVDFQNYLRQMLNTREYQKLIAYPPQASNTFEVTLLDAVHSLCYAFFINMQGYHELSPFIEHLIHDANQEQSLEHVEATKTHQHIWNKLACDYSAMSKYLKKHPNGPLRKVLDALENGNYQCFDTIWQDNLPMELYNLYVGDKKIIALRVPAPIYQEFIQKAQVINEFKGFLRSLSKNQIVNKFLLFNLQDRTSWREHSRCSALEDLQHQEEFQKHFNVVTLAKDTEFYHQITPFYEENHASVFIQNLKDQFMNEACGFHFPKEVRIQLLPDFVDTTCDSIHKIFFNSKNVLPREQRLDFIEIFYTILELKIFDILKPDAFSFTCKDAVDTGSAAHALLFAFLKLLNQQKLSESDAELMDLLIYAAPLFVRERVMLPEKFNRMLSALKVIEKAKEEFGAENFKKIIHEAFSLDFKSPILDAKLMASKSPIEVF